MIRKKTVPCNLCGSEQYTELYPDELHNDRPKVDYDFVPHTRKTYRIVKCDSCGLIFTNPMPALQESYSQTEDEVYLNSRPQRLKTAERCVERIRRHKQGGRLLDVGCATGVLLEAASRYFDVEGVELSEWAHARASVRHKVYNSPLRNLDFEARYDVVTLMGVIEHFEDPTEEIRTIHRFLKPGGLLVVYTGDVDAWLPRVLGKKWWWYQGMHLHYFSRRTCAALLDKCGFDVVADHKHCTYFQIYSLGISLKRYRVGLLLNPLFNRPFLKNAMVPLRLSGEMLMFATKRGLARSNRNAEAVSSAAI